MSNQSDTEIIYDTEAELEPSSRQRTRTESEEEEQIASAALDYWKFFHEFFSSKGAADLLVIATLVSFGIGSVIGLKPAALADRYARIYHDFGSETHCINYDESSKPLACQQGSDDAQAAAAWSNVLLSLFTLVFNPVVGSISDVRGRRPTLLLGLLVNCIPAAVFLLLLVIPAMDPVWYYASSSLVGIVNFLSLIFASLSDVIAPRYLAPAYGILLAGFYGGFSLAPSIGLVLKNPLHLALLSFVLTFASFLYGALCLPETLSDDVRRENLNKQLQQQQEISALHNNETTADDSNLNCIRSLKWICYNMTRPIREVSILNRDWAIRLVTVGSFFQAMVYAADVTLVLYYIEEHLNVQQSDIASLFFVLGITGIAIQAGLLQPLIRCLGEKGLLIVAFVCGTCHNLLYGVAKSKNIIYLAFIVSQVTKTNFPILSSMASKDVSANEQGRIQGALFAINALGNAIGPLCLEAVYNRTKKTHPGFMFMFAAGLYCIGTIVVSLIPVDKKSGENPESQTLLSGSSCQRQSKPSNKKESSGLEQPLLSA